jgi:hypothetical protein
MTAPYLCPIGWELYDKWDTLCSVSHEMSAEEVAAENEAWTAYLDHRAKCEECEPCQEP